MLDYSSHRRYTRPWADADNRHIQRREVDESFSYFYSDFGSFLIPAMSVRWERKWGLERRTEW